jgi:enoyl-CoA hydratase/carnithine racemase
MRWLLTGDELDAADALRIGLVQEVAPRGQELPRAIAIAETIARQAPLGVRATLRSSRAVAREGFDAAARRLLPPRCRRSGRPTTPRGPHVVHGAPRRPIHLSEQVRTSLTL